ncbi:hypothetical protein NKY71_01735 [Sinorhizobium meliloti]|uniref:hypothetical protein n=1 Tax=Rhizobium meliloti TaxID=382 RepID=UPI00299ECD7C|nr:hypothetical protein [Sinorhizobium meliloti]
MSDLSLRPKLKAAAKWARCWRSWSWLSQWKRLNLVIAKSGTASSGFLGIISWDLRWMNRWFERLSENEFQLKQFELDITRAQWVVETAFEWKMSPQSPIPNPILENISRNLFANSEKDVNADGVGSHRQSLECKAGRARRGNRVRPESSERCRRRTVSAAIDG